MKFSKNLLLIFCFIIIFLGFFLGVYFLINFTQSSYSTPSRSVFLLNEMSVTLGPPPNSTNIPLDTTIIIDSVASASVNDLHIIPETQISYQTSSVSGSLTYEKTFYPNEPLQPNVTYAVSATILEIPLSWTFTTTSEIFNPKLGYHLTRNATLIALSTASLAVFIFGVIFRLRKRSTD
jgi:hypothetical protein